MKGIVWHSVTLSGWNSTEIDEYGSDFEITCSRQGNQMRSYKLERWVDGSYSLYDEAVGEGIV